MWSGTSLLIAAAVVASFLQCSDAYYAWNGSEWVWKEQVGEEEKKKEEVVDDDDDVEEEEASGDSDPDPDYELDIVEKSSKSSVEKSSAGYESVRKYSNFSCST